MLERYRNKNPLTPYQQRALEEEKLAALWFTVTILASSQLDPSWGTTIGVAAAAFAAGSGLVGAIVFTRLEQEQDK